MDTQQVIRLHRIDENGRPVERWVSTKSIESFHGVESGLPWDSPTVTRVYFGPYDHVFNDHPWLVASALDWALDTSDFTPELRQSCDDALSGKYGWPWSMNA